MSVQGLDNIPFFFDWVMLGVVTLASVLISLLALKISVFIHKKRKGHKQKDKIRKN